MTKILIVASLVSANVFAAPVPPTEAAPIEAASAVGDAELIAALETLSTRFLFQRPRHQMRAVRQNASTFFVLLGAAALAGLRFGHHRLERVLSEGAVQRLAPVKAFADRLDRRALYGLAAYYVYSRVRAGWHSHLDDREVAAMRASLAAGDGAYAANLAQFFELTRAEQFLVAKHDPVFAEALVAYAEFVRTRDFEMESRFYSRAHPWDEISASARRKLAPATN